MRVIIRHLVNSIIIEIVILRMGLWHIMVGPIKLKMGSEARVYLMLLHCLSYVDVCIMLSVPLRVVEGAFYLGQVRGTG
jgi:hypothetical protein